MDEMRSYITNEYDQAILPNEIFNNGSVNYSNDHFRKINSRIIMRNRDFIDIISNRTTKISSA